MSIHLLQFLEKIDIFGLAVTFRIYSEKNHKTQFGGLITLLISSVILIQLFSLIQFVLNQDSPIIIQQQNYVYQPEEFLIRPNTFSFAFGLQNPLGQHFRNEMIYKVKSTMQTNKRILNEVTGEYELKVKLVEVKLKTCSLDNFKVEGTQDYFKKLPLDQLYCFDVNEQDIGVEGEFSASLYKQLNIQVLECTDQATCADSNIRQQQLGSPRLGIYVTDNIIQVTDKEKPYKSIGKNMFWVTGLNLQKEIRYQLLNNYIHTDVGIMTSDVKKQRVVSYSSEREQVINRQSSLIYNFFFNYEKNKEVVYYRKYMKLDQAFSQVGGTFNVLVGIGCLLCWPISQLELNRKIINSIFQVNEEELQSKKENNEEKFHQSDECSKLQNQTLNRNSSNCCLKFLKRKRGKQITIEQQSQTLNSINNKKITTDKKVNSSINNNDHIKKFFSFTFSEVKIKFSEYFMAYFNFFSFQSSPKKKLIQYGTDVLYNHIDIFNIVSKLIEFEKLKHLLLTENQLKLFEYLPKPTLQLSSIPNKKYLHKDESEYQKKLHKSLSFQINRKQNGDLTIQNQLKEELGLIFTKQKTMKEKAEEAYQAFYNICSSDELKSEIDQKLIQLIDPKLVNYFIENQDSFSHLNIHRRRTSNENRQDRLNSIHKAIYKSNQDTIKEVNNLEIPNNNEIFLMQTNGSQDFKSFFKKVNDKKCLSTTSKQTYDIDEYITNDISDLQPKKYEYKRKVKTMNLFSIDKKNENEEATQQFN